MRNFSLRGLLLSLILVSACSPEPSNSAANQPEASDSKQRPVFILIDDNGDETDHITANDLKVDFEKLGKRHVSVVDWQSYQTQDADLVLVGTIGQHRLLDQLVTTQNLSLSSETPGPRGGVWRHQSFKGQPLLVLAGSDIQGTQYATYDYSKDFLGLDPLQYWTGTNIETKPDLNPLAAADRTIAPPQIPLLVYFENDVDELANMQKPYLEYDWENYTQLIDALVRLRYNGIEFFDMLGRIEFYSRPGYQKIRANYEFNMPLLKRMLAYAHKKGMLVQIDMMMGRPFGAISFEESNCWSQHKQRWVDTWREYLTETPLKDADIFTLRPRNQTLDWSYKSDCNENRAHVFNEVYAELGKLLDQYRPNAVKVCVCYDDGMEIYNEGFRPPKDWIVAWSDDGWSEFEYQPKGDIEHKFGSYMHAGFWLNHDVHDPYPERIDEVMTDFIERYQGDHYLMVNGQTFRLFLINLEAFSELAKSVTHYDGKGFYQDWVSRYFGEHVTEATIRSLQKLHQAQHGHSGYVEHLWETKMAVAYLKGKDIERPGKTPIPMPFEKVEPVIKRTAARLPIINEAIEAAQQGLALKPKNAVFYHDHIVLPNLLYKDLISYNHSLLQLSALKAQYHKRKDRQLLVEADALMATAKEQLTQLYLRRAVGDKNPQWASWYEVAKRRPNNGFPSKQDLLEIEALLKDQGWR